jgi:hypothetical protein
MWGVQAILQRGEITRSRGRARYVRGLDGGLVVEILGEEGEGE